MLKLFLDDARPVPNATWHQEYGAEDAIAFLEKNGTNLTHISLDHDLGAVLTGYDVVCALELLHHEGKINPDVIVTVHSANPSGARKIALACQKMFGRPWASFVVDYLLWKDEQRNEK